MNRKKWAVLAGVAVVLLLLAATVLARGGYRLAWQTADGGGGGAGAPPAYRLAATIGQPDAGALSGPGYRLAGGFWIDWLPYRVYVPVTLRSH